MSELQAELVDDVFEVTLPRILDIPAGGELRDVVLESVKPGIGLTLKADTVEQVTTPGIQVLLAVAAHIATHDAKLTVVKPTDALINGFSDLGLFPQLMAWNVE